MKRPIVAVAALFAFVGLAYAQPLANPPLSLPHSPRVVWIGDSVISNSVGIPDDQTVNEINTGFITWVKMLTKFRIHSPYTFNFGVAGDTVEQVATTIPAALAVKPDICVFLAGRANAVGLFPSLPDTQLGTTTFRIKQIFDQLQAANCIVVAITNISVPTWPSTASEQLDLQINEWLRAQKRVRKGYYLIDLGNSYDDQASTTAWTPKANYVSSDNVHPGQWGAYVIGSRVASLFNQLYPDWRLRIQNVDDVYDPVTNPTGNLMPQQMFTGTAGTLTNGATGTVATGCSLDGTTLNGSAVAGSKTTTADGRVAQRITVSGTVNGGNSGKVTLLCPLTVTGVNQGDIIQCSIDANWGATTNIAGVYLLLQSTEGANIPSNIHFSQFNVLISTSGQIGHTLPTETGSGGGPAGTSLSVPLYTPARTLSGPLTQAFIKVQIQYLFTLAAALTVAGTFDFASPSCRKQLRETTQ